MGDRLGLPDAVYTRTSCSDVVSLGSENHVNQMARLTDFELDVKEPQWTYIGAVSIRRDPRKSTMWSTWHAQKAMNYIMNDNRPF